MTSVRNNQCKACPWKKSTVPEKDIPNGYGATKHRALGCTIAEPGVLNTGSRVMACHESPEGNEQYCVGWVINQLGPGNNLGLRLRAMDGRFNNCRVDGPQHLRFEDTLPKPRLQFNEAPRRRRRR